MNGSLFEISELAKRDRQAAEEAILTFVKAHFSDLDAEVVNINASKVSLNSVHGFLKGKGKEFFFKFHSEEDEEKSLGGNEYYQGKALAEAGLPMIMPLFTSTSPGEQFLVYEKITAPTAFEEYEDLEEEFLRSGAYDESRKEKLFLAEKDFLEKVAAVYQQSLCPLPVASLRASPLHQLFSFRLHSHNGSVPRLDLFYTSSSVRLPDEIIPFEELATKKWIINGARYGESLKEIIRAAKNLLVPSGEGMQAAVLGHGDDHNGNKFFRDGQFRLFDPAFAGWHPALLSFVKATVHNTFLHPLWLYDAEKLDRSLSLTYRLSKDEIHIEHNWIFPDRSPLRAEMLELYAEKVWRPLLRLLRSRSLLFPNWKEYLRKAFFCCPFLVYNLLDPQRFSSSSCLLALSKCVELGSPGTPSSYVDQFLDSL